MEMRAEAVINANADDAWVVVGERFGQISEWASREPRDWRLYSSAVRPMRWMESRVSGLSS
jgi:hypothetical protein